MPGIIKVVKTIAAIKPDLKGLKDSICPIDIDSTSIIPPQVFGSCRWYYQYLEHQKTHLTYSEAFKKSVIRFNYAQRYTETQPVEGGLTQQFLGSLKQHNKIVYVTARDKELAKVTELQLQKNNLPYNHYPEFRNKSVDLSAYIPGSYAKNGVIYTGGGNKGLNLILYLEILGYSNFSNIVAIDDKLESLIDYKHAAAVNNKNFLGFYYNAVDHTVRDDDLKIAEIQYKKHREAGSKGKFISDATARKILKLRKS